MAYNPYDDNSTVYGNGDGQQQPMRPIQQGSVQQPMRPIQQAGVQQPMRPIQQAGVQQQGGYDAAATVYGNDNGYSQQGGNVEVDTDVTPSAYDNAETMYGGDPNFAQPQQPQYAGSGQWQQPQQQWPQQPQQQWQQQQWQPQPGSSYNNPYQNRQPKKKSNTALIVLIFVIGVIVAAIIALLVVGGKSDSGEIRSSTSMPEEAVMGGNEYTDGLITFRLPSDLVLNEKGDEDNPYTFDSGKYDDVHVVVCGDKVSSSYSLSDFNEEVRDVVIPSYMRNLDISEAQIRLGSNEVRTKGDVKIYTQKLTVNADATFVSEFNVVKSFKSNISGKVIVEYLPGHRPDVDYIINSIKFNK